MSDIQNSEEQPPAEVDNDPAASAEEGVIVSDDVSPTESEPS